MLFRTLILVSFFSSLSALAYLPPCHFILEKAVAERQPRNNAIVYVSIYAPAETVKSADRLLGERTILFRSESRLPEGAWPVISLLLEADAHALTAKVRQFGIPIAEEKDLLRLKREQYTAMKEIPRPFYLHDKAVSLHRYRSSYAWSCENEKKERSLSVEKDSFIPLELRGPCPAALGHEHCTAELQNTWDLHDEKNARIVIRADGKPLYIVKIDHVILNPPDRQWNAAMETKAKATPDTNLDAVEKLLQ